MRRGRAAKIARVLHEALIILVLIMLILLSPILIPLVGFLHARDDRRMRALARTFRCQNCGNVLGERSIELADEAWAQRLREVQSDEEWGIMYRIVRNLHAICAQCGVKYEFLPKTGEFVRR